VHCTGVGVIHDTTIERPSFPSSVIDVSPSVQPAVNRTSRTFSGLFGSIADNVEIALRGKRSAIELALVALLSDGHILIEDIPGVGKTSLAKALAASINCSWKRVQFTPDLLPSDLIGVSVWSRTKEAFEFHPGPLFANIVLADEINRASPKTQSALLEAMEERQVSVDGEARPLPSPFLVIATQNPMDHDGTHRLPESQLDRFLIRMAIGYPDREAQMAILDPSFTAHSTDITPVVDVADVAIMIKAAAQVRMVESIRHYLVDIADATRRHPAIALGLSPRATVQMARAARTLAASRGRDYVIPDDVKELALPVFAHRINLRHDVAAQGMTRADAMTEVLESVPVPSGR
jgi:MoxR-like ATPase